MDASEHKKITHVYIYMDNRCGWHTGRYYNSQGVWVDSEGRIMPDNGRNWGNQNPSGPGANPASVHERFGERSQLAAGVGGAVAGRGTTTLGVSGTNHHSYITFHP